MSLTLGATSPAQWRAVAEKLTAMRERAKDVTPAWQAIIDWFAEQNAAQFATEGQRYRARWAPLAPSTLEEKRRLGYPADTLVRTRRLRTSLTVRPLGIEHVTPTEMAAGTTVRYARFHQRGTRHMPQRKLISAAQIRREQVVTTTVANWIIKGEAVPGGRTDLRGDR
jgi:hypothetical protein